VANPKAFTTRNSSSQGHGQEHAHAIVTLRSGRQVNNQKVELEEDPVVLQGKENEKDKEGKFEPSRAIPTIEDPPRLFVRKAPYPERLKAPKNNVQFAKILEVFKQIQISIPFFDAIQQVPSFLKDLVTIKRKTNVPKKIYLTEQVSSIL
jgi:hypothetical protein